MPQRIDWDLCSFCKTRHKLTLSGGSDAVWVFEVGSLKFKALGSPEGSQSLGYHRVLRFRSKASGFLLPVYYMRFYIRGQRITHSLGLTSMINVKPTRIEEVMAPVCLCQKRSLHKPQAQHPLA